MTFRASPPPLQVIHFLHIHLSIHSFTATPISISHWTLPSAFLAPTTPNFCSCSSQFHQQTHLSSRSQIYLQINHCTHVNHQQEHHLQTLVDNTSTTPTLPYCHSKLNLPAVSVQEQTHFFSHTISSNSLSLHFSVNSNSAPSSIPSFISQSTTAYRFMSSISEIWNSSRAFPFPLSETRLHIQFKP